MPEDRLTQLQDTVDQLATQFVASLYFINKHHDLVKVNKYALEEKDLDIEPIPAEKFKEGQVELAQDLILKEQQIEMLISLLPGLENSERDQEQTIKQLEEDLKVAEEQRKEAVKEKEAVLARLEGVIRSVKRP